MSSYNVFVITHLRRASSAVNSITRKLVVSINAREGLKEALIAIGLKVNCNAKNCLYENFLVIKICDINYFLLFA